LTDNRVQKAVAGAKKLTAEFDKKVTVEDDGLPF
jgi:hypothetical protein